MKSDKKCNNSDAIEQILIRKFMVKPPQFLLINTARSSFDGFGKVTKISVDIPLVHDISKYLTSHYDIQTKISTYFFIGNANFEGSFLNSGHYPTYHYSQGSNEVYCFDDQKVNCFNFDKLTSRNNSTFASETHTILYIR